MAKSPALMDILVTMCDPLKPFRDNKVRKKIHSTIPSVKGTF